MPVSLLLMIGTKVEPEVASVSTTTNGFMRDKDWWYTLGTICSIFPLIREMLDDSVELRKCSCPHFNFLKLGPLSNTKSANAGLTETFNKPTN